MTVDYYAFASDNSAGICPEAWSVLADANATSMGSYGDDPFTDEACQHLRDLFETEVEVFFVFNGTAANSLALASICQSYHAIIAHEKAHIMTDECGAPEHFTGGSKIIGCHGAEAKLTADGIECAVSQRRDLHFPKPRALSLTQATEFGTVYSVDEINKLTACAKACGLRVHLDGARFANAVASLEVSPAEMTWKAGIDVMSFGLTKLGAGIGEAVVFFDRALAEEFDYRCKQAGQLASKMRFLSAAWCGLLRDQSWLRIAKRVNAQAQALRAGLAEISGAELLFPTQANAVFARFPESVNAAMHAKGWHYYELAGLGDSRLMCSWATRDEDIAAFLTDLKSV
ncbi:MAG: threonine aldolase family protein [Verrucomicrobiales bacterium]|jgi:threonine aldolase